MHTPKTPSHSPAPLGSSLLSSRSNFISFQEAAVLFSMVYRSYVFPGCVRMFGFVPALLAEHTPPTPVDSQPPPHSHHKLLPSQITPKKMRA